jgi:hypothetical protein
MIKDEPTFPQEVTDSEPAIGKIKLSCRTKFFACQLNPAVMQNNLEG